MLPLEEDLKTSHQGLETSGQLGQSGAIMLMEEKTTWTAESLKT
jgi:hypothetical protein